MIILCLIESLLPGGAERQMAGLAALLKEGGHEVEVWTYYPQDFYRKQLEDAGVKYRCILKAQNKLLRIPVLLKEAKRWKPDAVIAYLPTGTMVACMMKLLGLKAKLIVSERNTSQQYDRSEKVRFNLFKLTADWVVPNSHMQEQFIAEHCPGLVKKVRVITNFVDTDFFSPSNEKRIESKKLRMVCVGRVFPQKNVLRFLDSIAGLKKRGVQLRVDWFGRIDGEYAEKCLAKVKELELSDIIEFRGATKEIRDEYRKADVFCLPSLWEGFPNVVCEAMSCGLPILCSNVCDNADIVIEGKNGLLFDPTNVEDMSEKIAKFAAMESKELETMSRFCRERSIELFSKERFIHQYEELLK